MKRVVFIDKLIRSEHGHYLEYARRLGAAFRGKGYEPVYIGNRVYSGPASPDLIQAIDFDFERLVLGVDHRALAQREVERKKQEAKVRRYWRRRLSPANVIWGSILLLGRDDSSRSISRKEILFGILFQIARISLRLFYAVVSFPPLLLLRIGQKLLRVLRRPFGQGGLRARGRGFVGRVLRFAEYRLQVTPLLRALKSLVFVGYRNAAATEAQAKSIVRALRSLDLGEDDIVMWPTLKEADLDIVAAVAEQLPKRFGRSWHMIFREPIYLQDGPDLTTTNVQRSFRVRILRVDAVLGGRACWWVDTDELAAQYRHLTGLAFGVLPVVVPPELAQLRNGRLRAPSEPITLGYFGDARPEKGFGELANLVQQLAHRRAAAIEAVRASARLGAERRQLSNERVLVDEFRQQRLRRLEHRVRLARLKRAVDDASQPSPLDALPPFSLQAQANFNVPNGVALTRKTRYKLQAQDDLGVALFLEGLSPAAYLDQFGTVDVSLLYYVHPAYGAGSSGVFSESITAGLPVVVTDATWGGRALRTQEIYLDHLEAVLERHGRPLDKNFGSAAAWWPLPAGELTHLGVQATFEETSIFDQVRIEFGFVLPNGRRETRTRLLCGRTGRAAALVAIPASATLCRIAVTRLDSRLSTLNWSLRLFGLDERQVEGPLCAAGIVVGSTAELMEGVIEIGRHIDAYAESAGRVSKRWIAHHAPESAVGMIVARHSGIAQPAQQD